MSNHLADAITHVKAIPALDNLIESKRQAALASLEQLRNEHTQRDAEETASTYDAPVTDEA